MTDDERELLLLVASYVFAMRVRSGQVPTKDWIEQVEELIARVESGR